MNRLQLQADVITWLLENEPSMLQKHMLVVLFNAAPSKDAPLINYPLNGVEFSECADLVDDIPELKTLFPDATEAAGWSVVFAHWDDLYEAYKASVDRNHTCVGRHLHLLLARNGEMPTPAFGNTYVYDIARGGIQADAKRYLAPECHAAIAAAAVGQGAILFVPEGANVKEISGGELLPSAFAPSQHGKELGSFYAISCKHFPLKISIASASGQATFSIEDDHLIKVCRDTATAPVRGMRP